MATSDKYDRQLRLWGARGQKSLAQSHVCCLGSTAVATETMKNLVLPGVGRFTIVDDARVTSADLGVNFFVTKDDLGLSRATTVARWLAELNDDVVGEGVEKAVDTFIQEGAFAQYSLVVGCLNRRQSVYVSALCERARIPFISLTTMGCYGMLRVMGNVHVTFGSPDSEPQDLRISSPFPELLAYVNAIDLASLDDAQHAHVPYIVILIKALDLWRAQNLSTNVLPVTPEEKANFKKVIQSMRRSAAEVNFDEALNYCYKAWTKYRLPDGVAAIFESPEIENPVSEFWHAAAAIKRFVAAHQFLPLAGSLPDMTSDTSFYVNLQKVYQQKARDDIHAVSESTTAPCADLEYICQKASELDVIRYASLSYELGAALEEEVENEDTLLGLAIVLAVSDVCDGAPGSPGTSVEQFEGDLQHLSSAIAQTYAVQEEHATKMGIPGMLREVLRSGGLDHHVTSSWLGGVASQEAVKLLTNLYTPINNTLLFDGLAHKSQTLEL